MRPKLVIFDCDGVLVDSEQLTNSVLQRSLARHGLKRTLDEIMDMFVGGTMVGVMHLARDMGADLPDNWLDGIYAEIYDVLSKQVEAVPNVINVLDALDAAKIPYAVGSNGRMRKMEITLQRTGMWGRLQGHVYSAQDLGVPKPAPDVYLKAANDAGIDTKDCVVIEDSASGARAAVAANMRCFGYCGDTSADKLDPYCFATFDDMAQLPRLLGL